MYYIITIFFIIINLVLNNIIAILHNYNVYMIILYICKIIIYTLSYNTYYKHACTHQYYYTEYLCMAIINKINTVCKTIKFDSYK